MTLRDFVLPDPGEGLEEAEVVSWLVAEGDAVELNQPFVEVETAKATVEIPSPYEGRVATLHAAEGDTVRVGAVLVTFDVAEPGEDVMRPAGQEDGGTAEPSGPSEPERAGGAVRPAAVAATPAVRRLAKDLGVELADVTGTGPDGRIQASDVEAAAPRGSAPDGDLGAVDAEQIPVTGIRRAIADRLTEVAAVPQVTTFRTLDCSALEDFRRELHVSPLPVFVVALVRTVGSHPLMNATWAGDRILRHRAVHMGIAIDTERGLVVPVVREAQARGIGEIDDEIRRLAVAARDATLSPDELSGSTIAVSNTGSYGSEAGTPLLNPGNSVTVALGVITSRALVVEGQVVARPACTISLTFDHRVLDGAEVGRALGELVASLQDAERLRDLPR